MPSGKDTRELGGIVFAALLACWGQCLIPPGSFLNWFNLGRFWDLVFNSGGA